MRKIITLILLVVAVVLAVDLPVSADDVLINLGGTDFMVPLKQVDGVQLYSLKDGKGYPGVQSILIKRGDVQVSAGAAPILGTSANVPFVGVQLRLPSQYFDVGNNSLHFGAYVGWPSNDAKPTYGLLASIPLW